MYKLYLFFKRHIVTIVSYRMALALGIVGGFVGLLQFTFMGQFLEDGNSFPALEQYGGNLLAYLIIGSAFTSFVGVSLHSFQGTVRSEQQMGTLEYLILSSTRPETLLICSGIMGFLGAVVNVSVLLFVVSFVFAVPLEVNIMGAAASIVLTVISLSGIGLVSAGIIIVTKVGDPVTWAFTTLTGLLSGVMFPVEYLPGWLQVVSSMLPTTHALHALRLALGQNASIATLTPQLLTLTFLAMVTVPVGLLAVRLGFHRAQRMGTLAHY